jgi:hypothetical protein
MERTLEAVRLVGSDHRGNKKDITVILPNISSDNFVAVVNYVEKRACLGTTILDRVNIFTIKSLLIFRLLNHTRIVH